jgi:aryl-alcohol dehydrogenase-like predicted oxidoreductase
LRRETLDIVQIHNATIPVLRRGELLGCLERARESGKVRCLGASVYGPDAALAAVDVGNIQVLQVALSLLDQRMCGQVLPAAEAAGVGVLTRSALLKGALTKRAQWLPESLQQVTRASEYAVRELATNWEGLPAMALRFCLTVPAAHTILVGVRDRAELESCLAAEAQGPLAPALLKTAYTLALDDELLLNPTYWHLEESDTGQVAV